MINFDPKARSMEKAVPPGIAKKQELPKGIEKAKEQVPDFVKDKLDIKFPGSGGGDNGGGISG
jgi:hypothetical protein